MTYFAHTSERLSICSSPENRDQDAMAALYLQRRSSNYQKPEDVICLSQKIPTPNEHLQFILFIPSLRFSLDNHLKTPTQINNPFVSSYAAYNPNLTATPMANSSALVPYLAANAVNCSPSVLDWILTFFLYLGLFTCNAVSSHCTL